MYLALSQTVKAGCTGLPIQYQHSGGWEMQRQGNHCELEVSQVCIANSRTSIAIPVSKQQ